MLNLNSLSRSLRNLRNPEEIPPEKSPSPPPQSPSQITTAKPLPAIPPRGSDSLARTATASPTRSNPSHGRQSSIHSGQFTPSVTSPMATNFALPPPALALPSPQEFLEQQGDYAQYYTSSHYFPQLSHLPPTESEFSSDDSPRMSPFSSGEISIAYTVPPPQSAIPTSYGSQPLPYHYSQAPPASSPQTVPYSPPPSSSLTRPHTAPIHIPQRQTSSLTIPTISSAGIAVRHVEDSAATGVGAANPTMLYGGEVMHSYNAGVFKRDTKEYLLLTNTALLRFRNMQKATQVFGNIVVWGGSSGAAQQTIKNIKPDKIILGLNNVVAIHASSTTIHVEFLMAVTMVPAIIHITAGETHREWLEQLRTAVKMYAPQAGILTSHWNKQREWALQKIKDDGFHSDRGSADGSEEFGGGIWRAIFKGQKVSDGQKVSSSGLASPTEGPSSPDGSGGSSSRMVLVVVGEYWFHILPHNQGAASGKDDVRDERQIQLYPLLTIQSISHGGSDDSFSITFGNPMRERRATLYFASSRVADIIHSVRTRIESLRWLYPPEKIGVMLDIPEEMTGPVQIMGRNGLRDLGFEQLMKAEGHALSVAKNAFEGVKVDGWRIKVVEVVDEDERRPYSVEEIQVLFRALRYNTAFKEISFAGISFQELTQPRTLKDGSKRAGLNVSAEIYELIVGNPKLRVLDLTKCDLSSNAFGSIGKALEDGYTQGLRMESLKLGNNNLDESIDVNALAKGLMYHAGTMHHLELGYCRISGDGLSQILHAFSANNEVALHTLEYLGLEGNHMAVMNAYILDTFLKQSMRLETLNLKDIKQWTKSPILQADTLTTCMTTLKSLNIGGIHLQEQSIQNLTSYIQSDLFDSLEQLYVEDCGLNGEQLSRLFRAISMSRNRHVEMYAGGNPISLGDSLHAKLCYSLVTGEGSSWLSLARTSWNEDRFREFIECLCRNTNLQHVDLSYVRLTTDRDATDETCAILGGLLKTESSALRELILEGEETLTSVSRIGKNLWRSFEGLGMNTSLVKLNVRRNAFGDRGAFALGDALRVNHTLKWLDMDENDVSSDGFNAILSAFHPGGTPTSPSPSALHNTALTFFAMPKEDLSRQLNILHQEVKETFRSEQEVHFFLANTTGKDAREWREKLDVILRGRKATEQLKDKLAKTVQQILQAVERNKMVDTAVRRDRETRSMSVGSASGLPSVGSRSPTFQRPPRVRRPSGAGTTNVPPAYRE